MRDINRILCPVDLSDVSRHAIDHAFLLARRYRSTITALHVCNPIVIPSSDFTLAGIGPPPILTDQDIKEVSEQVRAFFDSAKPVSLDVLVQSGRPATQILEAVRLLPADLVVIGTHGSGGFQHMLLGSVTEKVIRQATCPVLTVPPRARTTSKLPFRRLLCPVDFSDSSLAALDFAFSLAREGNAQLIILHVFEWPTVDESAAASAEYRREREYDATIRLQKLVPESLGDWCRPSTRLSHGKAYQEILGIATEDGSDLIVMGVHGRNPLDLMMFGSNTNQVVRRATCPVLTLRR